MSADSFQPCPKCYEKYKQENKEKLEYVKSQYGKIDQDEYLKLMKELRYKDIRDFDTNFIENRYVSTYPNGFEIDYNGSCSECNFSFGYRNDIKIPLDFEEGDEYLVLDCRKDEFVMLYNFLLQHRVSSNLILQIERKYKRELKQLGYMEE